MDDKYIELLKSSLDDLNKATIWIFVTLIAIAISISQKDENLKIGSIEIKKANSGILFYLILCSLNFQVLKLLINIEHIFNEVSANSKAVITIQLNSWIFNPFAKTSGILGNITDNLGYPILITMWWIGFALAQKLIEVKGNAYNLKSISFFIIYLLLGLFCLIIVTSLIGKIEPNSVKLITQFGGIFTGLIAFSIIMKKL